MKKTAYDIMRDLDAKAGISPRSDDDLDMDVAGGLTSRYGEWDYDEWKQALENDDLQAILEAHAMWGLHYA